MKLELSGVRGAMVRLACDALEPSLSFYVQTLGFRIEAIFPADNPGTAILSGHGLNLELVRGATDGARSISLLCDDPRTVAGGVRELLAPNGVVVKLVWADPPMRSPETRQELVLSLSNSEAHWSVGRAGLRYRDLLPQRHGGAFIASHIRILDGGPVPDYVHYHKVRFQVIFCRAGWVRVAYEGQGEPFVLHAGDCALQPPMIRHRVLESSAGAEVVEIGTPAEHVTIADHSLELPSAVLPADHDFHGQRFVRHIAAQASWAPWRIAGFAVRDIGIEAATSGLAGVRVVRRDAAAPLVSQQHATEFCFYFVLAGEVSVRCADTRHALKRDDSITLPAGLPYTLRDCSDDLEMLEITLPASFEALVSPAPD